MRHAQSFERGVRQGNESAGKQGKGAEDALVRRLPQALFARAGALLGVVLLFVFCAAGALAGQSLNPTAPVPFDHIGYGNLTHSFSIPVVHKAGRGLPFTYQLAYHSHVWSLSGSAWVPDTNWGWLDVEQGSTGWISYEAAQGSCPNAYNGPYGQPSSYYSWTIYQNWEYHDPHGVAHPFPSSATVMYGEGSPVPSCAPTFPTTASAQASDGSGYTIYTSAGYSSPGADIRSVGGATINPPLQSGAPAVGVVQEDHNGNEISRNSNDQYIDTLGVTELSIGQPSSLQTDYAYPGPAGATEHVDVYRTSMSVRTAFGCSGISEYSGTANLVTKVTLADGSSYQFTYEPTPGSGGATVTGRFATITLPTGAILHFTYGGSNDGVECSKGLATNFSETITDGGGTTIEGTWNFQSQLDTANANNVQPVTTTVTDPANNATQVMLVPMAGPDYEHEYEYERDSYQGAVSATPLITVTQCYNGATTCANSSIGSVSQVLRTVKMGTTTLNQTNVSFDNFGDPTEMDEYGSSSAIQRKTLTTYQSWGSNDAELPSDVKVEDGNGNLVAETTTSYDESGHLVASGITTQHDSSVDFGNPTTIRRWVGGSSWLTRSFTIFDTGTIDTATDPNTSQISYSYGACAGAFPTQVNLPVNSLSTSATWDCNGGVMLSSTNLNGGVTSYSYGSDPFWRQTQVTTPDNSSTAVTYNVNSVESVKNINSNSTLDVLVNLDSLGRPYLRQQLEAPGSGTWDSVETKYDLFGRASQASQPYTAARGSGPGSVAWTTTSYDALGRISQATDGGGGTRTYTYNGLDTLLDVGPAPSPESDKRRQFEYDGLGRLTSVCEITSSLPGYGTCGQTSAQSGYWTTYQYNLLDRLTTVTQNAQSSTHQTRSFSYDALGRLTQEVNPENGTTTYSWDSDSNCTPASAGDLVAKYDANGTRTCFQYDALHRATVRSYAAGAGIAPTPASYFVYDSATVDGTVMTGVKGRLAEAYTPTGNGHLTDLGFSYDAMGNAAGVWQYSSNVNTWYHLSAGWFPNGALQTLSGLPGLPTIQYSLEGEGRPATASDGILPNNLAAASYTLTSTSVNLGSSTGGAYDTDSFSFDANTGRMTQYQFNVNGAAMVSGTMNWNANGILASTSVTDNNLGYGTGNPEACSYAHDDLARLSSINCGSAWTQTFRLDAFGNITKAVGSGAAGTSFQPTYDSGTNRISASLSLVPSYTGDGNLISDPTATSSQAVYGWDAADHLVSDASSAVSISYDALGRAVEVNGGPQGAGWHAVVYGPAGGKLAIMNGSSLVKAWVALPGGETAVYTAAGSAPAYYEHPDLLGSSRLATTPARALWSDQAYAPYGENIGNYSQTGAGALDLNFTGQTPDGDGSLYDFLFRHYSPTQGRWLKPDPAGLAAVDPGNPQSWNRYAYVMNRPTSLTDPLGLYKWKAGACTYDTVAYLVNGYVEGFDTTLVGCDAGSGQSGYGPGAHQTSGGGGDGNSASSKKPRWQCAAEYADNHSLYAMLGLNSQFKQNHPVLNSMADAALGNSIAGVAGIVGNLKNGNEAGANRDLIMGGIGVPRGALGGAVGKATDFAVNNLGMTSLEITTLTDEQVAEEGLSGPLGWAKLGVDIGIFAWGYRQCAHQQ